MKNYVFIVALITLIFSCKSEKKDEAVTEQKSEITVDKLNNVSISSGTLHHIENFPSEFITERPVDIWLPDHYSEDQKFAVLYMHDGQMLFDSTTTWNKQEWKVDEWASTLMEEGKTKDFIVVAINNISETRWQDYFPAKTWDFISIEDQDKLLLEGNKKRGDTLFNADNYLKFLTQELKLYIDSNYSVLSNQQNTFIAGSSMGGLISMYAVCEYPNIFGGAACISTHWPGAQPRK